jgi:transcriptional regulator with XRE-family HTH domain
MARKNPWLRARNAAGLSLEQAVYATYVLPAQYRLTKSKLSRLENGLHANVHPFAFQELANCYGRSLRDIEPAVADELDALYVLAAKYAPRDSNPEPADSGESVISGAIGQAAA